MKKFLILLAIILIIGVILFFPIPKQKQQQDCPEGQENKWHNGSCSYICHEIGKEYSNPLASCQKSESLYNKTMKFIFQK